jgi:hypothetical protein
VGATPQRHYRTTTKAVFALAAKYIILAMTKQPEQGILVAELVHTLGYRYGKEKM